MSGDPATIVASIAAGASLSDIVDMGGARLCRIIMPNDWTTANLTFQASMDGTTFKDLYDSSGTEYTVTAAANRSIIIPIVDFAGIKYLKVRSGTSGSAVTQTPARLLTLVLFPF